MTSMINYIVFFHILRKFIVPNQCPKIPKIQGAKTAALKIQPLLLRPCASPCLLCRPLQHPIHPGVKIIEIVSFIRNTPLLSVASKVFWLTWNEKTLLIDSFLLPSLISFMIWSSSIAVVCITLGKVAEKINRKKSGLLPNPPPPPKKRRKKIEDKSW